MQNPQQLQGIGSLRQPYGLGKLVKKAFKKLKKVAKSPLGKAALIGLGGWGLSKYGLGASGIGKGWFGKMIGSGAGQGVGAFAKKWLNPWQSGKFSGKHMFGLLGAGAVAAPFIQKALKWGPYAEDDEEEQDWSQTPGSILNLRNQAQNYYRAAKPDYLGSPFMPDKQYVLPNFYAAEGGRAGLLNGGNPGEAQIEQMLRAEYLKYKNKGGTMPYEQFKMLIMKQAQQDQTPNQMMAAKGGRIKAQEGGALIDLGGQEKDYRENGGFVPLGEEERADDVPARLSKNEFVFTADAVRAAGGGDIDAGAEVMENIMENLEQGGEISEESQGQNPAQGMYNNYEQLQSRVA